MRNDDVTEHDNDRFSRVNVLEAVFLKIRRLV